MYPHGVQNNTRDQHCSLKLLQGYKRLLLVTLKMLLSLLVHTKSLRFGIPAFILVGVSPHFFTSWLVWRFISSVLPRPVYERVDEMAYDSYQSLVTFFFETYNGTKLVFYGDELPVDVKENVIYISNHQSAVDWIITDMMAIRQNVLGKIRYILKSGLRYLPLYGCYFAQHGCVYVRRRGAGGKNDSFIRRRLRGFIKNKTPFWLVIFPEGTRYDIAKPQVIKNSQDFARKNGLPVLQHHLTPRTRALELSITELEPRLDAVYDVTVAYKDPKKPILPKAGGLSLTEFLAVDKCEIHIHLERVDKRDLPKNENETKTWVFNQFVKKDKLMSHFYNETSPGEFPGGKRDEIILRTRRTFPYFVFWTGVLAATLATSKGRSLYLKMWSFLGLSSVLYMTTLYDFIQA